ncbi:MAG: LysR family transcriptional regulator [Clostridia bacterium]|nr:LysR family transcriptional regulator [Clostridia bacterium]
MMDAKLETLLTVYEKNSFTRAAEKLSLTQPAVSHHIRQLEDELGVKLFHRKKGELKLTAEGEIVVKYAKRIRALYQKMSQDIRDEAELKTKITVGITRTAESNLIAEVLAKYGQRSDGVSITILTDSINNLYDMLLNYELDLAIVEERIYDPNINRLLLDTDYLVCVVANNSPLAKKSMVTISDIQREKLILRLPSSDTRNLFISHLESLNLSIRDFNVVLEVDNIATIKDLIRKGMGISILARSACLGDWRKRKITLLPIENMSMIRETNILYHKDFGHVEILRQITKIYNETAAEYK